MSFWQDKVKPAWKKIVAWLGVGVAVASGAVVSMNTEKVPEEAQLERVEQTFETVERGITPVTRAVKPKTLKRITGGKYVRVVGAHRDRDEVLTDVGQGIVLSANEIDPNAQCFVVMDAKIKDVEGREQPDITGLEWHPGTLPVKIDGSEKEDSVLWAIMLKGQDCVKALDFEGFVGSDMPQFLASKHKGRFLKSHRKACPTKPPCGPVSVEDKDADLDDEIWAPVSIMGRDDLNWGTAKKGKVSRKNVFVRK